MLRWARELCRRKGEIVRRLAAALCIFLFATPTFAASGTDYLASQQSPDGSFGSSPNSLATPLQSTAEVLGAYQALGQQSVPGFVSALAFLNSDAESNTEFLARKVIVNAGGSPSLGPWLAALLANQADSGGFGHVPGYDAAVLDTAFALEALASANATGSPQTAAAVGYLLSRQQPNGGWADGDNETSVYLTALTTRALWYYRFQYAGVSSALAKAQTFLLAQRNGSGLWDENFNSALALIALVPLVSDLSELSNSISALQAAQLTDGSWSGDAYTTALVLRAINAANQPRPDPNLGAIVGRVLDSATNTPIASVTVTATGASTQTAITGADGRYAISNVAPGAVTVSASVPGYVTASGTGTVPAAQVLDFSPRLIKDVTPVLIALQGSVVRSDTAAPLSGATVRVLNSSFSAQTQADGRFTLSGIPPGSLRVEITLSGFSTSTFAISAASGGVVDFGIVPLVPGSAGGTTGAVQGVVLDALTDLPLRNVLVSLSGADSKTALTDVDGRFVITGVNPGNLALAANLDGYLTATAAGALTAGATLNFNAKLIKVGNPVRTTVTGRVVDATTGIALNGVAVTIAPNFATNSIADGTFSISDIPAGTLTIGLSFPGYVGLGYTASAPGGGVVALGTIGLAPDVPISGNRNPVITSRAPTSAVAGQVYAYNVQATDADNDALTFALSTSLPGMTISPTGQVRWVPTVDQAGVRTFTVVVFDSQGGRAQEIVNLNVSTGGSRSYVVTDVQTLSGLYVNDVVPNNYRLGTYISGANPGFVTASPPCPLTWFGGGSDVAGSLARLDRLTGANSLGAQPASGRDIILDMGQAYTSITVFPQIDHGPFPQEGIEYTVWGSNDPNAAFPSGWRLASLVSIYRKGYVVTPSCGGQDETDDYAGLYTFGLNSFRYIRVRADFSITIFNTPAQTTWEGSGDDGGEPGWQSSEAEIDAVGGMVCDVTPQANAGADIVGLTGQTIRFDASASQGNIRTYGWDLDGDGVIDLTGPAPTRVFAGEFDRDVTLIVVDDRGCVGTDKVRVTIGLNLPRPDLTVNKVETANVVTDAQTLRVTGSARVTVQNIGRAAALVPATVTVFEDTNRNGAFDRDVDNLLGSLSMTSGLERNASLAMDIPITGTLSFRDAAIYAMVDSDLRIVEEREDNNVGTSAGACQISTPSAPMNIAPIYGVASANSVYTADTSPQFAIDGNVFTMWNAGRFASPSSPASLIIDLKRPFDVGQIVLQDIRGTPGVGFYGFNNVYNLYVSLDGTTWVPVASGTLTESNDPAAYSATVPLLQGVSTLRYVKYEVVGGTHWAHLNDLEIWASPGATSTATTDLGVSLLRLTDLGSGQLRANVRVGNGGASASPATTVGFYDGDPAQGGVLLGSAAVGALQPGQYQDVALEGAATVSGRNDVYAVVDPNNQIVECRKGNNSVHRPVQLQSSSGRIAVGTDAPRYAAQSPVQITATVTNTSTLPAVFNATLRVEDASGAVLANFGTRAIPSLAGGASANLGGTWNTNGYLAGIYQARAQLVSVDGGGLIDEAVGTFVIENSVVDAAKLTLRTTTDRAVYNITDLVNIKSLVVNVTTNTLIDGARLRLRVKDAAGTVLFVNEGPLGQLAPSALRDLLFPYGLTNAALGLYVVEGQVLDGGTGEVLASSSAQYRVTNDLAKSLVGEVTAAKSTVEIGTTQLCTYTVTNRAPLAVAGLTLRMTVVNVSTGAAVESAMQNVDLPASGSQSIVRTVGTGALVVGDYACALEALIDGTYRSLGFAAFKVVEPPIHINASMSVADKGRLLILLDAKDQCEKDDDQDSAWAGSYGYDKDNCPKDTDPHGPQAAPGLTAQRSFLESLLKKAGWSYKITDDADAFASEFKTGGYYAYAILSEQAKLDESLQKELREATFSGDALVVAGSYDNRNGRLNDALGIKRIGTVAHADSATIGTGPLGVEGSIALIPGDRIDRVKRTTAQSLASYHLSGPSRSSSYDCRDQDEEGYREDKDHKYANDDDCHGQPDTYTDAITLNGYGRGKALFAGFDLLAQAAKDGPDSLAAQVLLAALDITHPKPLPVKLGGVLPIKITLTNQGIATPATIKVTVPTGTTVTETSGAIENTPNGQVVTLPVTLAVGEVKNLVLYVRVPNIQASVALHTAVDVVAGGATRTVAQADLTLTVDALVSLDDVLAQANTLSGTLPTYRSALKAASFDIEKAIKARTLAQATGYLLSATDDLLGISDPSVVELRRRLDEWLRYNLMLLN